MKLDINKVAMGVAVIGLLSVLGAPSVGAGQQPAKPKLTAKAAEGTALKKYKTGKVQGKTALEKEDGKWQYAVIVKVGSKLHEVMVNAITGKIESEETVTPKEEAAEKKAEAAKAGSAGKKKTEKPPKK